MTFVEQGMKQPMLSCFLSEHDHLSRSYKTSPVAERSSLNEHNKVQGFTADGPNLQLATASTGIPHWMCSKQGLDLKINTSPKNGCTSNMAISSPQALQQNPSDPFGTFSLPNLGMDPEGKNDPSIATQSIVNTPKSGHLFQKHLPSRSSIPAGLNPQQAPIREQGKENPKEDLVPFLLHKEQKQAAKECPKSLPGLPLSKHDGKRSDHKSEVSSWVSRFPFQISPEAHFTQSVELRGSTGHQMFLEPKKELFMTNNSPSQLAGSKNHTDHHTKFLIQQSSSLKEASNSVLQQQTQASLATSPSKWALFETLTGSYMPSSKRDWNATFGQSVKPPQALTDFFAQQKVIAAGKVNPFNKSERLPEIICKDLFPQKTGSFARVCEEIADRDGNSSIGHQDINKQDPSCGMETQKWLSHDSFLQTNILKVEVNASSEDFGASCSNSLSRETMGRNSRTSDFRSEFCPAGNQAARQPSCVGLDVNKVIINPPGSQLVLFAECASPQLCGSSSNVSATAPPLSLTKQPYILKALGNGVELPEGDSGVFLAGSRFRESAETNAGIMLPFQQRFDQLQEFLKKCDGSENQYCQRAFQMLSASARSDHVAELESRASRLSFEEGNEMKRAKLLNMLEDVPVEDFLWTSFAKPMGPCT